MVRIAAQRSLKKKTAVLVTVKLGFLRQDDFFAEDVDDIQATTDHGILKVVVMNGGNEDEIQIIRSYNAGAWKSITSRRVASRAQV